MAGRTIVYDSYIEFIRNFKDETECWLYFAPYGDWDFFVNRNVYRIMKKSRTELFKAWNPDKELFFGADYRRYIYNATPSIRFGAWTWEEFEDEEGYTYTKKVWIEWCKVPTAWVPPPPEWWGWATK
jgi:hypothetical protein